MRQARRPASWLTRNERQLLFVWLLFVAILAAASLLRSDFSDALRPVRAGQTASHSTGDDSVHTGSILLVPREGDQCWQRLVDNQSGRIRDQGLVPCASTGSQSLLSPPGSYSTAGRTDAIRKGFLGTGK